MADPDRRMTLIEEVSEQLKLNLQDTDYDTIAGYVLGSWGECPVC
jgi:CBS domain containing-hemolysin-like protein